MLYAIGVFYLPIILFYKILTQDTLKRLTLLQGNDLIVIAIGLFFQVQ